MKRILKLGTTLLMSAALGAGLLLFGCGESETGKDGSAKPEQTAPASSDDGENVSVTLNEVAHSIFYAPMYVAMEEGYFEEEGIALDLVCGFGADKVMTAVLSGEADIGFMGPETTVYTANGGSGDQVVNFAQLTQRAGNFLVSREQEEDFQWSDLIGRDVLGGRAGGMRSYM